jgi:hypothetical protein
VNENAGNADGVRRTDLDIPESTVWPASDDAPQAPVASREALAHAEAGGDATVQGGGDRGDSSGEQIESLDPGRDDTERNAAAGGWEGANEQIENDFEVEQLREAQETRDDM